MANPFIQYLQDTRGELRHVAWPTRLQTIVYAVLVAAISVVIALYLGFFDFVFTTGLKNGISNIPAAPQVQQQQQTGTTSPQGSSTVPAEKLPSL